MGQFTTINQQKAQCWY